MAANKLSLLSIMHAKWHTGVFLFKSSNDVQDDKKQKSFFFYFFFYIVSEDALLNAPFNEEEIWQAIQSMPSGKTPGPDGFPLEFYKQFLPNFNASNTKSFRNKFSGIGCY